MSCRSTVSTLSRGLHHAGVMAGRLAQLHMHCRLAGDVAGARAVLACTLLSCIPPEQWHRLQLQQLNHVKSAAVGSWVLHAHSEQANNRACYSHKPKSCAFRAACLLQHQGALLRMMLPVMVGPTSSALAWMPSATVLSRGRVPTSTSPAAQQTLRICLPATCSANKSMHAAC